MSNKTTYIHFHNDTDLPVIIDSFVDNSNILQHFRIGPREKFLLHSSVGEWHVNAMLNKEDRKIWDDNPNLKHVILIGKFRSDPCARGNYSWLEYDNLYSCIYTELETPINNVKDVMTFTLI